MAKRSHFMLCSPMAMFCLALLAGCSGYAGRGLQPGISSRDDVLAVMGQPAMRWKDADGSEQLAYPRGPDGPHTYMALIAPDGRLQRLENVLDQPWFARIAIGKSDQATVLRLLGPPTPAWTAYYPARDELVWEWLFCDEIGHLARFDVLFDGASGLVRNTMQREDLRGPDGVAPPCSRAAY